MSIVLVFILQDRFHCNFERETVFMTCISDWCVVAKITVGKGR
jgi:hypothetical protein